MDTSDISDPTLNADPGTEDTGEAMSVSSKIHYTPIAPSVTWKPGCGMRPPDGHVCETGLFLTFTRAYADLKVTKSVQVDNAKKTITVKLDTWSTSRIHPMIMVSPQTEPLEVQGAQHSTPYAVRIVNWKGGKLWSGTINMMFAP